MSEHIADGVERGVTLSVVLELVGLLEFYPKFQKHDITDFNYFKKLTVQEFVCLYNFKFKRVLNFFLIIIFMTYVI